MPVTLEERVAYLEGKVEEHSKAWQDLKDLIIHLDGRMVHLEQRITELDTRINQRITELDTRINQRIDSTNQRIDSTNQRIDRLFFFVLATLASSIGSLIAAIVSIIVR